MSLRTWLRDWLNAPTTAEAASEARERGLLSFARSQKMAVTAALAGARGVAAAGVDVQCDRTVITRSFPDGELTIELSNAPSATHLRQVSARELLSDEVAGFPEWASRGGSVLKTGRP